MSRVIRYTALSIALFLYISGCIRGRAFWHWLNEMHLVVNDYRFGDLYRLSSLPQFKDFQVECPPVTPTSRSSSHLYLIGDSFSEELRITLRDLPVQYYHRTHWENQDWVQLDTTVRNVLVLESVERHVREHLSQPIRNLVVVADTSQPRLAEPNQSWGRQFSDLIQATGIEDRFETLLFSQDGLSLFKEAKAYLNQHFFGRVSPKIGITADGKHLFTGLDVDTTRHNTGGIPRAGSFTHLTDADISQLVDSLNATRDFYLHHGFDEVYLALIPNKASIEGTSLGAYNHLIERIQQHPALRLTVIDGYGLYKQARQPIYAVGDSHWNCTGRALWLREVQRAVH